MHLTGGHQSAEAIELVILSLLASRMVALESHQRQGISLIKATGCATGKDLRQTLARATGLLL